MVEFALVAPILFLVLFGIIEFGWTFAQVLDTRHGAREAARLVAVNYNPSAQTGNAQTTTMLSEICARLDDPTEYRVTISLAVSGDNDAGDKAEVRVERNLDQLTGFFDPFLAGMTPASEVTFRLERDASWNVLPETSCP